MNELDRVRQEHTHELITQLTQVQIPAGKTTGEVTVSCPFHEDKHPSMSINLGEGLFKCHGCGAQGNVYDLIGECRNVGRDDAIRLALQYCDSSQGRDLPAVRRTQLRPTADSQHGEVVLPIPVEAGKPPALDHQAREFSYENSLGEPLFYVARIEHDGRKEYRPRTYRRLPGGSEKWSTTLKGIGDPRPLYNLREVLEESGKEVLVVEGEPAVEGARELLPEFVVTSTHGGTSAVGKADLSALRGRCVVIWPDADKPGLQYADELAARLQGEGATVRIVELPSGLPKAWDLADLDSRSLKHSDLVTVEIARGLIQDAPAAIVATPERSYASAQERCEQAAPKPLRITSTPLPDFPINALPSPLAEFVAEAAREIQVDAAAIGPAALAVLGACVAGKFEIQPTDIWTMGCNLGVLIVAETGEGKSPAIKKVAQPLRDFEARRATQMKGEFRRAQLQADVQEKVIKRTKDKLVEADSDHTQALLDELVAAEIELGRLKAIRADELFADDATPERIAMSMAENHERIFVCSGEPTFIHNILGRYAGDGKSRSESVLSALQNETVKQSRVNRPTVTLHKPSLSVCVGIQPGRFEKIAQQDGVLDSGLPGRFLFAYPPGTTGTRTLQRQPISRTVQEGYIKLIDDLASLPLPESSEDAPRLRFSKEAEDLFGEHYKNLDRRRALGGDLYPLRDWSSKAAEKTARLAGVFHCVKNPTNPARSQISRETVEQAIELMDYFLGTAWVAYGATYAHAEDPTCEYIVTRWKEAGEHAMSQRDLQRLCRKSSLRATDIRTHLEHLRDAHGLVVGPETVTPEQGGRETQIWALADAA